MSTAVNGNCSLILIDVSFAANNAALSLTVTTTRVEFIDWQAWDPFATKRYEILLRGF